MRQKDIIVQNSRIFYHTGLKFGSRTEYFQFNPFSIAIHLAEDFNDGNSQVLDHLSDWCVYAVENSMQTVSAREVMVNIIEGIRVGMMDLFDFESDREVSDSLLPFSVDVVRTKSNGFSSKNECCTIGPDSCIYTTREDYHRVFSYLDNRDIAYTQYLVALANGVDKEKAARIANGVFKRDSNINKIDFSRFEDQIRTTTINLQDETNTIYLASPDFLLLNLSNGFVPNSILNKLGLNEIYDSGFDKYAMKELFEKHPMAEQLMNFKDNAVDLSVFFFNLKENEVVKFN